MNDLINNSNASIHIMLKYKYVKIPLTTINGWLGLPIGETNAVFEKQLPFILPMLLMTYELF